MQESHGLGRNRRSKGEVDTLAYVAHATHLAKFASASEQDIAKRATASSPPEVRKANAADGCRAGGALSPHLCCCQRRLLCPGVGPWRAAGGCLRKHLALPVLLWRRLGRAHGRQYAMLFRAFPRARRRQGRLSAARRKGLISRSTPAPACVSKGQLGSSFGLYRRENRAESRGESAQDVCIAE